MIFSEQNGGCVTRNQLEACLLTASLIRLSGVLSGTFPSTFQDMPSEPFDMTEPTTGAAIFVQQRCLRHRFIRSRDTSNVVERPERLRAVHLGLAAAVTRIRGIISEVSQDLSTNKVSNDEGDPGGSSSSDASEHPSANDITASMASLNIAITPPKHDKELPLPPSAVEMIRSEACVDIHNNAAVKFIHGDIDGDVYLDNLSAWVAASAEKIAQGGSEIPEGLSQSDLYCK